MVFGATDKTLPRRESFPAGVPPGAALPQTTHPGGTTIPPLASRVPFRTR